MAKLNANNTCLDLGKPTFLSKDRGPLFGQGILTSNGSSWAHQRKIIAPQFYMDKVKGMVNLMVESITSTLSSWEAKMVSAGGFAEIRVDEDLRCLSADIISRASFGSDYTLGKAIFSKVKRLNELVSGGTYGIPGLRYAPTKHNRETWRLEKEINSSILKVVKERRKTIFEKDLLQMILDAAKTHANHHGISSHINPSKFIVSNCKNIYLAGHETTATTASWCLVLLAAHQDWQARVRTEVTDLCKGKIPDANMLHNMKLLNMVIQETLRLYPATSFLAREAYEDMNFKNIQIPKGIIFWIPITALHHNPQTWGPDVYEFNPERFSTGTKGACKVPQTYMPFGWGPRVCAGQNFAMMELKAIMSLILSKFQFSLSETYRHSPTYQLLVTPKYGVHLQMKKI